MWLQGLVEWVGRGRNRMPGVRRGSKSDCPRSFFILILLDPSRMSQFMHVWHQVAFLHWATKQSLLKFPLRTSISKTFILTISVWSWLYRTIVEISKKALPIKNKINVTVIVRAILRTEWGYGNGPNLTIKTQICYRSSVILLVARQKRLVWKYSQFAYSVRRENCSGESMNPST